MIASIEDAARLGGSRGLMQEGQPQGFDTWPAAAQVAFAEQYARGRRTRAIAEGKTTSAKPLDLSGFAGMSRQALAEAFDNNPALRAEFLSMEAFIAYAVAAGDGRARIIGGRVVS